MRGARPSRSPAEGSGELAHARDEAEPDVRVAVLDHGVKSPQVVAVGARHLRRVQRVEDRLVVLVDQHHHAPPRALVQRPDQVAQTPSGRIGDARRVVQRAQAILHFRTQIAVGREVSAAEAHTHDGVAHRPVPPLVYREPLEKLLAALEQLLQRIQERALAEAARTRQEVVRAPGDQTPDVARLVDVVAAVLPHRDSEVIELALWPQFARVSVVFPRKPNCSDPPTGIRPLGAALGQCSREALPRSDETRVPSGDPCGCPSSFTTGDHKGVPRQNPSTHRLTRT